MKKFLIPATLLLASTLGGAAFAGSAAHAENEALYGEALYGQPNPFAAVESPALMQQAYAGYQDPRLSAGSQQASMTYVPQHQDWAQPAPAAHDEFHDPE